MQTIPKNGTLSTIIHNKIATVEFGHPSGNSFPGALLQELTEEIESLGKNADILVIVLKSAGNGPFCAGASFDELLSISNLEQGTVFFSRFANAINAMRNCTKLIIGRIHGKAVGGGVGLASACDYAIAHTSASIKLSELTIGIGPFVIEPAVSRKIGKTAFAEMSLSADEWKTADWARAKGLYAQVYATAEELDEAILVFSEKLASYNPEALLEIKTILWEGTENWETLLYERAAISGNLVLSDFTKKALAGFRK